MIEYGNEVNPPLEDALAHYGVKGMKWGVRKASGSRPSGKDIMTARKNVKAGEKAIRSQKKVVRKTKDPNQKEAEKAKLGDLKSAHLKNPDRLTALHMTKGEAVVNALLAANGHSKYVTASLISKEIEGQIVKRELKQK